MLRLLLPLLLGAATTAAAQLNDIVERTLTVTERVLPHPSLREADVFWQKRTWQLIDTREKKNLVFRHPDQAFMDVLRRGLESGDVIAYRDDQFREPLDRTALHRQFYSVDTATIFNLETLQPELQIVENTLHTDDVKRFRISEIWYFDHQTSQLRVRILGVAPLREEYDENGNFLHETPMFWVHLPSARSYLAQHDVFVSGNEAARYSWDDLFEQRRFASVIYRESNLRGDRLQDRYSGRDQLLAADRIRQEIFNWEQDRWSR